MAEYDFYGAADTSTTSAEDMKELMCNASVIEYYDNQRKTMFFDDKLIDQLKNEQAHVLRALEKVITAAESDDFEDLNAKIKKFSKYFIAHVKNETNGVFLFFGSMVSELSDQDKSMIHVYKRELLSQVNAAKAFLMTYAKNPVTASDVNQFARDVRPIYFSLKKYFAEKEGSLYALYGKFK